MSLVIEKCCNAESSDVCKNRRNDVLAVVFDFGGVLMSYKGMEKMCVSVSSKIGIPKEDFENIILRKRSIEVNTNIANNYLST
uniref:HAD family hydrolase n=1 Tax=Heterorhabditis bacteriophora TaxID=37862 RepID=A0A1I7WPZ6_HETBA